MVETPTKKEQILSLFLQGKQNPEQIGKKLGTSPSYVANVLRKEGYLQDYFDLYTSTQHSMNTYSRIFANRLGFKTKKVAQRSVNFLDRWYQNFKKNYNRTGQHHALVTALTMFNRARWIGKKEEAAIFQQWIIQCLNAGE